MIVLEEDLLYANSWSIDVGSAMARRKESRDNWEWVKFLIVWYILQMLGALGRRWQRTASIGSIGAVEGDGVVDKKAVGAVS
jgi:uncharacterized protein affecting Mg2+/Co2+ transport